MFIQFVLLCNREEIRRVTGRDTKEKDDSITSEVGGRIVDKLPRTDNMDERKSETERSGSPVFE